MNNTKIKCAICNEECHVIQNHLEKEHPEMSLDEYKRRFPNAPVLSDYAKEQINKFMESKKAEGVNYFHDVFGFDHTETKAFSSVHKNPIPISVMKNLKSDAEIYVPKLNKDYVFNVAELKDVMFGVEENIPIYIWGHKGAGKTELVEQICARTNRPLLRVQHTVNTEESQIVGQWIARGGEMEFELGPLPMAMMNGWTYLADEYDFAMPNVLAVYQAVLEGKPLVIKEAPIDLRIIKPHKDFRFFATGNTNGAGDESGLYQGTTIQNSANYDRFGVVVEKTYLARDKEVAILRSKTAITEEDAKKLVDFAKSVRDSFSAGKISDTISPRTLLFVARIGFAHGSFYKGLKLSFLNKLSSVDKETCYQYAQRVFGGEVNE